MLKQYIDKYNIKEVIENTVGMSKDKVLFLKADKCNYYLKISTNQEIVKEVTNYQFLTDVINVPKIYEFEKVDDTYYLLMSEIKGKMLYELLVDDIEDTIITYASVLKQLHSVSIEKYPIEFDLISEVKSIKERLSTIDLDNFEFENQQQGIEKTYEKLLEYFPKERDIVLCHGDYCMPNIIVDKHFGLIDMARARLDDRYQDIALALRSLKFNIENINKEYTQEYENLFLNTYGIDEIDEQKRIFYYLLDEFY